MNTLRMIPQRWLIALGIAAFLHFAFLFSVLRRHLSVSVLIPPILELDYIKIPPKAKPKKKRPPPKVEEKKTEPKPVPLAKAPVEAVADDAQADLVSAPKPARTRPKQVDDVKQLDNVSFAPIYNPRPKYPPIAFAGQIEGYVVVELLIDEKGRVRSFKIREFFGHPQFATETSKVIPRWRFPPPRIGGRSARVRYEYRVKFTLE